MLYKALLLLLLLMFDLGVGIHVTHIDNRYLSTLFAKAKLYGDWVYKFHCEISKPRPNGYINYYYYSGIASHRANTIAYISHFNNLILG